MKKKVEVQIVNDKGETTFYNQQIVDDKDGNSFTIPLGKIIKQQRTGKVSEKQPIH